MHQKVDVNLKMEIPVRFEIKAYDSNRLLFRPKIFA